VCLEYLVDLRLALEDASINVSVNSLSDEKHRDFLGTYERYELGCGRNLRIRVTLPFGTRQK
jgi:hypothetical protein